jgi:peptide/nickel transport system substrate-binding protein
MMPSHVIADELGIDVTQALQAGDPAAVQRIADAWNTTWDLKPGIDLKKFPAAGPYKIDAVLPQGAVVLVANDRWWGAAPVTSGSRCGRAASTSRTASTTAAST